jgi:hypothetical protein
MHVLSGTSSKAQTFPLFVYIGTTKLLALIDSGSTTTFLDPSVIDRVHIPVKNHSPLKVTVANGNILWTQAICNDISYTIQGHQFSSDFHVLELQGYDIILGCDWIYDHNPIGINLKTREFTLDKDGTKISFKDETLSNKDFLISHKKMKSMLRKGTVGVVIYVQKLQMNATSSTTPSALSDLLEEYSDIFKRPLNCLQREKWTIKFHSNLKMP